MSDVFLSYASADRDRAKMFADVLAESGWSVWWDRTIPPGKEFDQVIEEALESTKCVVVLWSKNSVASRWVKTEAGEAMQRTKLIPVMIDEVKLPLEFKRVQAADLSQWNGERSHPELARLFDTIAGYVNRERSTPVETAPTQNATPQRRPEQNPLGHWVVQLRKSKVVIAGVAAVVILLVYGVYREYAKVGRLEEKSISAKPDQAKGGEPAVNQVVGVPVQISADEGRTAAKAKSNIANPTASLSQPETLSWKSLLPDYVESFEVRGANAHWWMVDKEDLPWVGETTRGVYCITNTKAADDIKYFHVGVGEKEHTESPVAMKVRIDSKEGTPFSGVGLLYRFDVPNRFYYALTLSSYGDVTFYKRIKGGLVKLFAGQARGIRSSEFNTLGILGKGPRFYLYINEILFQTVEDSEIRGSKTGFIAMSTGRYCMDDLTIYRNISTSGR